MPAMSFGARALLDEAVRRADAGERVILCVITETHGSTPQPRGAKMIVLQSGQTLGTLGGGCVEAEVRTRVLALSGQEPAVMLFSLDQDYGWDDGLVCGGKMAVLATPITSASVHLLTKSELKLSVPGAADYVERIDPPSPLLIAGAGHVGEYLARFAADLDFAVTVVDDRDDALTAARFPNAIRLRGDIAPMLKSSTIDSSTFIVIVTRGHKNDAAALRAVIDSPARYIGLIGSKRKIKAIYDQLLADGVSIERLQAVHAPIGLDIDAVGPSEIAVSVLGELIAVRRGAKNIPSMKLSDEEIERWLSRSI